MGDICVRARPCWDQNSERVFASSAKLQLPLHVRGLDRRMRIQNVALKIHFPVPNVCAINEEKNDFNSWDLK